MLLRLLIVVSLLSGILTTTLPVYTNDWAVEVAHPDVNPYVVAARHGFTNLGNVRLDKTGSRRTAKSTFGTGGGTREYISLPSPQRVETFRWGCSLPNSATEFRQ